MSEPGGHRSSIPTTNSTTIVISDLHLSVSSPGVAPHDSAADFAFVSFLDWAVSRALEDDAPWRLVLLGDFLDLLHAPVARHSEDPAVAALEAVASWHRPAFAALGAAAQAGLSIEIVPGNHDSELLASPLQERLRELVGAAAVLPPPSNLRVEPWFLLVPGLLYAEHGSQYHALNAVPNPLLPSGRWSNQLPPGALLDLHLRAVAGSSEPAERRRRQLRAVVAMLRAAVEMMTRGLRGRGAAGQGIVGRAHAAGLRPATVAALQRLARDSPVAFARSVLAAARGVSGHVEAQQRLATATIHRLLAAEEKSVPVYVFAHTHRAAYAALQTAGQQVVYVNSGAWAEQPARDTAGVVGTSYSFVEVTESSRGITALLRRWDPDLGIAVTVAAPGERGVTQGLAASEYALAGGPAGTAVSSSRNP